MGLYVKEYFKPAPAFFSNLFNLAGTHKMPFGICEILRKCKFYQNLNFCHYRLWEISYTYMVISHKGTVLGTVLPYC